MGLLVNDQRKKFSKVLIQAYPMRVQFAEMLFYRLDKSLDQIAATNALGTDIFYVIQAAESEGWTARLINAVRESRPENPEVQEFARQFNLTPVQENNVELELIIKNSNGFLDVANWRSTLGKAEIRLCRVEVPLNNGRTAFGTGFLVGPDAVLTNYHVIEPVVRKQAAADNIVLRFDYKRLEDGTTLNEGTTYNLEASNWLIASTPYSNADLKTAPADSLPGEEELDFALLRVAGSPAEDFVGKIMEPSSPKAPRREYFKIPDQAMALQPGEPVLILQHPQGDPLKLAIDTNAGLAANANNTRLRYTTNTLPGSSGSPCFNINWQLVALHHAGDPNFEEFHKPQYNQGIPIHRIHAYLAKHGKLAALGL